MRPDFLAIGHIAKDLTPDGFTIGGAVTYAGLAASRLGLSVGVVTSAAADLQPHLRSALAGLELHLVPSTGTTTFRNTYRDGRRTQVLTDVGGPIEVSDIPDGWSASPVVLLGPLAQEVGYDLARHFPTATVVASIQGWLRRWDGCGRVTRGDWDGAEVLPHVDAAVCSIDDVSDEQLVDRWKGLTPVFIHTRGREGANIHYGGECHYIPAFEAQEVDPTGAGDVFAASYMVRLSETSNVLESARFASCAASFCVEAEGTTGIPTRAQVEARLTSRPLQVSTKGHPVGRGRVTRKVARRSALGS